MLTRDRMTADIATALHLDPSELVEDDNLFDLGLDSMRVMDLMLRWEADGLKTDFSRFYEVATLTEWWQIIAGSGAARA